ncbi:bifunctional 2-polyprenyl-6-hydroxyphenol methylase/3-demethylubiquinol 3-O-methyltransferase UbiG [Williamsia sp. CHRR-6]|uniref:class I SAM-dependent methyltransferase n=1 Tax=Williamsia sp. CHRR-6 TaxID=2835871 RepID=UPI001BD9439A|nr:class I SAM-dependent methyltransferase [Williamsia sp. CHRR-6]MBT0566196.1 class I SAM-dependent methyltransferase [Williamsia sp. CHRR-6]
MSADTETNTPASPADHWEARYAQSTRVWSGRVNATMAAVVAPLPKGTNGTALDLGCGEGGDAVWLAEHGWQVTAVDISPTAVARGAQGAAQRGVAERITWIAHDLSTWTTEQTFDLITASFFHSTVEFPRTEILRRVVAQVNPGGHLVLVTHVFESEADIPPWASRRDDGTPHMPHMPGPDHDVNELALDPRHWQIVTSEIRTREATGPDGVQTATLKDGVVVATRLN